MKLTRESLSVLSHPASVLRGGSGPAVLLLHGWGSRAEAYKEFLSTFPDDVAEIVIPDLPGFGSTPLLRNKGGVWGVHEYASWVKALLDVLSWNASVMIIGHSFGGQIALMIANSHPETISGLILYAAAVVRPAHTFRRSVIHTLSPAFRPLRSLIHKAGAFQDWGNTPPELQPVMEKIVRQDMTHLLPGTMTNTIILWGDQDRKTPIEHGRKIAEQMPNAELRIIQGAGHSLRNDAPEQFRKELLRAIQLLTSSQSPQ